MNNTQQPNLKEKYKTSSRIQNDGNSFIKSRLKQTMNIEPNIKQKQDKNQKISKKMNANQINKSKGANRKDKIVNINRPHTSLNHQSRLNKVLNQDNFIYQKSGVKDSSNQNVHQVIMPTLKKSRTHKKNVDHDNPKVNPKLIQMIAAYCPRILTQVGLKRDSSMERFSKKHFKCQVKQNFVQAMVTYFFQWKKKIKFIFQALLKDISGENDFSLKNSSKDKQSESKIYLSLKEIEATTKQCQQNLEIISKQNAQNKNHKKITQNTNMMHQPMAIVYTQQSQKRNQQKIDIILKDFQLLKQYVALLMKLLKQYQNFIIQANQCLKTKSKDNTEEYFKQIRQISIKYHKNFNEIIDICLKSRYHQFLEKIEFKIKKILEKETDKYLKVFQQTQILNEVEKEIENKFEELNQLLQNFITNPKNFSSKNLQNIDCILSDVEKLSTKMQIDLINQEFQKKKKLITQKVKKFKSQYGVKLIPFIEIMFKDNLKKIMNESILIYLKYEGALYLQIKKSLLLTRKLYQQMKCQQSQAFSEKIQNFRIKISQKLVQIMQYEADITILKKEQSSKNHKQNQLSQTLVYLNEVKSLITNYQNSKQQICVQMEKIFSQNKKQPEVVTFILSEQKTQKNDDLNLIFAQGKQDIKSLEDFIQLLKWTRQIAPFIDIFQLDFWSQNDILSDETKIWQTKLAKLIEQQYYFQKLAQSELIQFLTPVVEIKTNTTMKKQQKNNSQAIFSSLLNMHSDSLPSLKNQYQYQFAHCFQQIEDVRRMALKIHEKKDKIRGVAVQQFRQFVQQKKNFLKNLKNGQNAVDLVDRIYSSMSNLNCQSQGGDKQSFIQKVDLSLVSLIFEYNNQGQNIHKIDNKLVEHIGVLVNLAKNLNKKYLTQQFSNLEIILSKIQKGIISIQQAKQQSVSKSPLKNKKNIKSQQILSHFDQFFKMIDINFKTIYQKKQTKMYLLTKNSQKQSYCKVILKNFSLTDQVQKLKVDQVQQISQLNNMIWKFIQEGLVRGNETTQKHTFGQIQKQVNKLIDLVNYRLNTYFDQIIKPLYAFKSYPLSNQRDVQDIISKQIQKFKISQNVVSKFKVLQGKHYPICWQLFSLLNQTFINLSQTQIFQPFYKVILDDQLIVFCATSKQNAIKFCLTKFFNIDAKSQQKQNSVLEVDQIKKSILISEQKIVDKCSQILNKENVPLNQKKIMNYLFDISKNSYKANEQQFSKMINEMRMVSENKKKQLKNLQKYRRCLCLLNQNKNVLIWQNISQIQYQIQLIQCLLQSYIKFVNSNRVNVNNADKFKPKIYPVQDKLIMLKNNSKHYKKIQQLLNKCKIECFKLIFGDQLNDQLESKELNTLKTVSHNSNNSAKNIIGLLQDNNIQTISKFLGINSSQNQKKRQQLKKSLVFSGNSIILTKNIITIQFFSESILQQITKNLKNEYQLNYFLKQLNKFLINIRVNDNSQSSSFANDNNKNGQRQKQSQKQLKSNLEQLYLFSTLKELYEKKQYLKSIQTINPRCQAQIQFIISGVIDLNCHEQLQVGLFGSYRSKFLQEYLETKIKQALNKKQEKQDKFNNLHQQKKQSKQQQKQRQKQGQKEQNKDQSEQNKGQSQRQLNNLDIFLKQLMIVPNQAEKIIVNQTQKIVANQAGTQTQNQNSKQIKKHFNDVDQIANKNPKTISVNNMQRNSLKEIKQIKQKNDNSDEDQQLMIQIDLSQGWNVQQTDFIEYLQPNTKSKFREKQSKSKLKQMLKTTSKNYNNTAFNLNQQRQRQNHLLQNMEVDQLSIVFSQMNIEDRNTIVQFNKNIGHLDNFVDVHQLIQQKLQQKQQKIAKQKQQVEKR